MLMATKMNYDGINATFFRLQLIQPAKILELTNLFIVCHITIFLPI